MTAWIGAGVVRAMEQEAAAFAPLETGGAMLGWCAGDEIVIAGVIGPGPLAMHGRFAFVPDHRWQIAQIRMAFQRTGGDLNYLGDWHSHPNGEVKMSRTDAETHLRICKKIQHGLMLIAAGSDDTGWSIACWQGVARRHLLGWSLNTSLQETKVFEPPQGWPSLIMATASQIG